MTPSKPNLGWYSRGYLPHCDEAGLVQHIVFSLADSVPPGFRSPSAIHADRLLDAGHGACALRESACAEFVENALLHSDGELYRLIAWCVMPNHVHTIVEQIEGYPLGDIVQSWKSATSHKINAHLGREGRLWRREYFDRFMRDDDHLSTTIAYVEANPVRAKLAAAASDWRFSSARRRA
jgi:REP element-mobilizing transposase RayT